MPFDNVYRIEKTSDESCILSLFGFKIEKRESSYSQSVYVSDSNTLSGQRKVTRSHSYEVKEWKRKNAPSGKALELEDKLVNGLMKVNRFYSKDPLGREYFNPMKIAKPYLSVKEYYEKWECVLNGPSYNKTRFAHLIALLLFIPWFALYSFIYPVFEKALGQGGGAAAYVFGVPLLFLLIYWGAYKFFDWQDTLTYQKYQQSTPSYYSLSEQEREDLRQRYYTYLERAYGEEAGKVLKQYFQMKNYDI